MSRASLPSPTVVVKKPIPSIQPIDFIEQWSLCHHLACVVGHIAQAGVAQTSVGRGTPRHSSPTQGRLWGLKQAEWFLAREITNKRPCAASAFLHTQSHSVPRTEAVVHQWGLPEGLGKVLFYIVTYQKLLYRLPQTRVVCLKEALRYLRLETQPHKQPQALPCSYSHAHFHPRGHRRDAHG